MTTAPLHRISVAILSYNRREELRKTLKAVCRPEYPWHEVIVADNGSTDGTVEFVRNAFPDVRLLALDRNIGVEASNRAYLAATAPWVLSLDDDSAPAVESFDVLAEELAREPQVAALALSVRRSASALEGISGSEIAYGFSSAGVLFNRAAIESIGPYDPELFLFTNELHWTARALLKGWCIRKYSGAVVVHRSAARNRHSAKHAFYYSRNLLLFLLRYAPVARKAGMLSSYFRDLLVCSFLHRTGVYLRACNSAWNIAAATKEKVQPMTDEVFRSINPDLRAGFGYLG